MIHRVEKVLLIELEERNIQHQRGIYAGSIEGNVRRENIIYVFASRSQEHLVQRTVLGTLLMGYMLT